MFLDHTLWLLFICFGFVLGLVYILCTQAPNVLEALAHYRQARATVSSEVAPLPTFRLTFAPDGAVILEGTGEFQVVRPGSATLPGPHTDALGEDAPGSVSDEQPEEGERQQEEASPDASADSPPAKPTASTERSASAPAKKDQRKREPTPRRFVRRTPGSASAGLADEASIRRLAQTLNYHYHHS